MDNLEEMDKFLEKYNFSKLNQEEIENLNRSITSQESVIKILPTNKSLGPNDFTSEFYQKFREELTPILEKAMAPHSSTLAWKIPWMEEPGGLQSMGSQRVRHD